MEINCQLLRLQLHFFERVISLLPIHMNEFGVI